MDLGNLSLGGVYLIFLVIGVVQFAKEQGWVTSTPNLKLTAALAGIFFGGLYTAAQTWPETLKYISMAVFIIASGISASGLFDAVKQVANTPTTTITTIEDPMTGGLSKTISKTEPTVDTTTSTVENNLTKKPNGGE